MCIKINICTHISMCLYVNMNTDEIKYNSSSSLFAYDSVFLNGITFYGEIAHWVRELVT